MTNERESSFQDERCRGGAVCQEIGRGDGQRGKSCGSKCDQPLAASRKKKQDEAPKKSDIRILDVRFPGRLILRQSLTFPGYGAK